MANTPEQNVHSALKSLFTRTLPRGRWMLQRIETSTGTGIPDNYFSFQRTSSLKDGVSMWIETKTVAYKASNDQLNWASSHWLTGGLTYIVTRVAGSKTTAKQGIKHTPTTAHNSPTACSNAPAYTSTYPTLLELLNGVCKQQDNCITSYDQLTDSIQKKGQETIVFLSFDDRMRECSTLGAYLRKFNPDVLPVETWVQRRVGHLSQPL